MLENGNQITSDGRVDEFKNELEHHQLINSHFRRIFDFFPDGVLCTDSEGRIVTVNPALEVLFGYKEEEMTGRQTGFLYNCLEDYEHQGRACFNQNTPEVSSPVEAKFRKKNGEIFIAEIVDSLFSSECGELVCIIRLIRDITKRKNLEHCLRQEELQFRTIADFAYNMECWTRPDGSFLYISPSSYRITGYAAGEFMENHSLFSEMIFPEDRTAWEKHHHQVEKEINLRTLQFRIVRCDGEIRWIEHTCQAVVTDDGEFKGYHSSNQDITQRKDYEERLHQTLSDIAFCKEQLEAESAYLREKIKLSFSYENIIGNSNALQYIFFKIEQIADTDTSVLLLGETGTGKGLFASAIHSTSLRKKRPLIKINCAALPANLIESELFGHEKGSFTGAHNRQIGRFEIADKATIFLDEIGELPLKLQAKLLRVLQEGEFERLGGSKTIKVDVRVIAATNRDLEKEVKNGLFRKDLWYRLNVFPITAPPLRERPEDIPQLVTHFMERFSRQLKKNITTIPKNVMQQLENCSWPGNVRELENVIERAVINSSGPKLKLVERLEQADEKIETNFRTLEEMERSYILRVLEKTNWKVSGKNSASEILGLQRSTLRAKIDKYKIRKP
jgi:chemotaxis protein methyltransferase CheR